MFDESALEAYTTASGLERYRLPAICQQMNRHRYISSDLREFAIHKALLQEMLWGRQLHERGMLKHKKLGLEMNSKRTDLKTPQKIKIAEGRTEIAQMELKRTYRILACGLAQPLNFDWDFFKNCPNYPIPKPSPPEYPPAPVKPLLPREPSPSELTFQPKLDAMDKLVSSRRQQKEQEAQNRFEIAHKKWEQVCLHIKRLYEQQVAQYKQTSLKIHEQYVASMQDWEQQKTEYQHTREECVKLVERKKAAYLEHEPNAVLDYFDMALACSPYHVCFPHSFEIDYYAEPRILIIDYLLPSLRVLPRLAKVVYHQEDDSFHDIILSDQERDVLYVQLLYELPLRTFYELFNADNAASLNSIVFRGYIFLEENKESGKPPSRVIEVQTDRANFAAIDLFHGSPADIFEEMGGIIRPLE